MAKWSEPFLPSSAHFRKHPQSLAGRVHRKNQLELQRASRAMGPCPTGGRWRTWDIFGEHDHRRLSPRIHQRCGAARTLTPLGRSRHLKVTWVGVPSHASSHGRHLHAETTIDGCRVHIDYITRTLGGPGRALTECRIFVDGQLAGRGGKSACALGFGGSDLPAVAQITESTVVTVDIVAGVAFPIVELWECADDR